MTEKTGKQLLENMSTDIAEIKVVLKGYDGDEGLVKKVENNTKQIAKLWIAIAAIIASTGGGTIAIIKAITGINGG